MKGGTPAAGVASFRPTKVLELLSNLKLILFILQNTPAPKFKSQLCYSLWDTTLRILSEAHSLFYPLDTWGEQPMNHPSCILIGPRLRFYGFFSCLYSHTPSMIVSPKAFLYLPFKFPGTFLSILVSGLLLHELHKIETKWGAHVYVLINWTSHKERLLGVRCFLVMLCVHLNRFQWNFV